MTMLTNSNFGIHLQVTFLLLLTVIINDYIMWVFSEGTTTFFFVGMDGGEGGGVGDEVFCLGPQYKTQNKKRAPITSLGCKVQLPC